MKLRLAALWILFATGAAGAEPGDLAAAHRLVADVGGFTNIARVGVQTMIGSGAITSPDLFRKVYAQYLEDHAELIAKADGEMAQAMTQIYTTDELNSYIAFEESPAGRAIMQKQFAASQGMLTGQSQPAVLTPEEQAARDAFYQSPQGKALNQKFAQALGAFLTRVGPYMQQINAGAIDQYCKQGGDCSNLAVRPRETPSP